MKYSKWAKSFHRKHLQNKRYHIGQALLMREILSLQISYSGLPAMAFYQFSCEIFDATQKQVVYEWTVSLLLFGPLSVTVHPT